MSNFLFDLNEVVSIGNDGDESETGTIVGRAEYSKSENNYLVRYRNANGVFGEQWHAESVLTST